MKNKFFIQEKNNNTTSLNTKKKTIIDNLEFTKMLGFWTYLMSDCIMFATLFSVYFVLHKNIANGPKGKEIFELSYILLETIFLLISSITCDCIILSKNKNDKKNFYFWSFLTIFFGTCFIFMELSESYSFIQKGYYPNCSAFLSSLFVLLGTHFFHVIAGIIWMIIMMIHVFYNGFTIVNKIRLHCLALFWHFLDIIWIFIYTFVYLMEYI